MVDALVLFPAQMQSFALFTVVESMPSMTPAV
jgi:hypothetical protein